MRRLTSILMVTGAVLASTLAGLTGAANASATVDLIWAETGTNEIGDVELSSAITLQVILTAGPGGSIGGGVSVDYGEVTGTLTVLGYMSTPDEAPTDPLPLTLSITEDTGSRIQNINSGAFIQANIGTGLMPGQSKQLGTVTFHKLALSDGTLEIRSDANGPTDGVLDLVGNNVTAGTTFNSAFLCDGGGPCPTPTSTPISTPTPTPSTPTPTAHINARVDLIWASSGTDTIANVPDSSAITLQVILTSGSGGSEGAGVSVDYGSAVGLTVLDYMSTASDALPILLGSTVDTGTRIQNVNSAALPPDLGTGLTTAGQTHQLGTITFHKSAIGNGTVEIRTDAEGPTDGVLDLAGNEITSTVAFNSAYLINEGSLPTPTAGATPTASPTPIASPTPTASPTPIPEPSLSATPTVTPIPTPAPAPTAPPTWDLPRPRGAPPLDPSCLCEIENVNPNQVVLKNVGTGGRGSETTRTLVMNLTAVDSSGANCEPGESSLPSWIKLEMVDDDGDVLVDHSESVTCEGGGVTTTVKWDVFFQGPLNCENGAVPPPKPGFSAGTIAITGAAPLRPYYYESTRIKCFE